MPTADTPQRFSPGQRWLSEAEPELGLGRVVEADGRHVRLDFGASGQQRTYAAAGAPLARVRFAPGDRVEDARGRRLDVRAVVEHDGRIVYRCSTGDGVERDLPEQQLGDRLQLNGPKDRLLTGRIDGDAWFRLRYRALRQAAALSRSPVFGLQGPRIELVPHQLYIAAEVASRAAPRVLLADEVGLGKTIEAGLILHRLLLTGRVGRVLVIVPDALVNQWLVEMLRRFSLRFALFDRARFDAAGAANPLHEEQRVLCGLSLVAGAPDIAGAVVDGDWDLVIVDEAHHLAWRPGASSDAYDLVEGLAARTPALLLLTATPEQLGRAGHFGRLRLLDPQRFHDYEAFVAGERAYAPVAEVAARLLDGRVLEADQRALLRGLLGDEADLPAAQVVGRLVDRHGTGRVLFRNTRQAISGFPRRRLRAYALAPPADYAAHLSRTDPEQGFGEGWTAVDPRIPWLRDLLQRVAPDKVLLICAHADTAVALRDHLLARFAIHAALFHEHMEIVARDRAAAFFAEPDGGAPLLICSEIGSEGRNFQFAHHLVLFDLPLDPDLLEQRIGRLDRIGQRHDVELHVPYLAGSAGEILLRWYRDGLDSFAAACPAAGAVASRLGDRLRAALGRPGAGDPAIDALVADAAALTARLNDELEAGRDRLLELHSFDPARAEALIEAVRAAPGDVGLAEFLTDYWDAFGVEHEPGPGGSTVLRPGGHMLHEHFPALGGDAATVTFDRGLALAHEDWQFLTWEHPMARGCIELLTGSELGTAAVVLCRHAGFRTGSVLLELLFVVECVAPPDLGLERFLPPTCLRLLLDGRGRDRAAELAPEVLEGLCLANNRKLVDTVLKSQATRVKPLVQQAEETATVRGRALAAEALDRMHAELDGEQRRLAALARVNPNVRDDEIEWLARRRTLLAEHLAAARVRLDALRLVVMG